MCFKEGTMHTVNREPKLLIYNVGLPTELIALNILGPLPLSKSGNQYLLIL